ncbi:cilia- and flagella-associated protein 54-like [Pristis pectinata]|uniref:cilia- and flagella-associated protein 54-like n=1 Tax=Pristis pectinata TaxID=685728 RepID=UPI00223DFB6D|nr:cilia- and flagella-associated protein 54-like [Pristis pectinata]
MESSGISFKYSKDFSEALLHRAGIWGCLLAGILTAKIAQFITLSDFKFKIDCCILSSFFFKALFRTTLPHPRNDREYATYEIGFDCDVVELIPGIDLFSDRFRADIRTVVGSLNFVLHELHAARQNLLALPLFTLYQYFVSSICRDVQKSVEARILKMKALTDLGLFAEAFAEHHALINGEKIPDLLLGGFRPSEPKVQMKFDQSNQLLTDNLQALEEVLKTPLSPALRTLYGPQLENKFELGRIHLIIKLAETINHIPESVTSQCPSTGEKESAAGGMIIDLDTEDVRVISHLSQIQGATQECHPSQEKSGLHKHLTLPQLKDVVLQGAQNKLNIFMETLKAAHDSEFANLPPAALEMVIDAKLQSAAIAFQRLQLAFSAAIALSALQLLQRARILTKHKQEHKTALGHKMDPAPALRSALKSTQHEDHINKDFHQETWNMEARGRLHMGLWLKCRLAMVTALTAQIYSAGLKKEGFLDTSQLCEEGVMEAKDYGDVETQAEFMLQEVLLDFQLGYVNDHIRTVLQLVLLGETARHQSYGDVYSCLAVPLKNVYLPHIILMAKIKLRIGNAVAQLAACSAKRRSESTWQEALSTYSTGLQLCREAVSQEADLEADLLLQKGKVLRQLTEIRSGKSLEAANFLMEAINVSHFHGQNTWLIRQAYLELVLLYFHISEEDEKETENNLRQDQSDNKLSVKSGIILIPKQVKKKANCILHSSQKLTRDKSISEKHVANMVQNELHEYILLDILASHEDYQTENDELLPSLSTIQGEEVEEEKKEASETVEDPDIMAPYRKIAAKKLTSVHLLRYNDQLRRLYNISLLPVQSENENAVPLGCKTQSTEPQMHEDFWKYAMNSAREGVHTPVLNTGILQRLERMHLFLIHHLPAYNTYCCVESIPNILYELFDRSFRSPEFQPEIYTSVFGEYTLTTPETSYIGKITPQMSMAVQSTDKEFCVQWFLPPLGISSTSCETQKVLFLYAYNVKPITLISIKTSSLTNASCGYKWVYLKRLVLLHKKLSALRSKAEMYLQPELKSPSVQLSINRLRQRYTRTDSALNIRKLPTQTEEMVMSLCREIKEMFLPGSIIKPEAEVPFDITTETLEALEKIFNPSSGYVLNHGSLFTWLTSFIESD